MDITTNYQLLKFGYDDPASIIDFMGNFDTIDALLKSANDALSLKAEHTEYIANADLNTLLEDKSYICAGTLKNAPVANTYCFVRVYDTSSTSRILQVCYVPQTDNSVRMFHRVITVGSGTTVGPWRELATANQLNDSVEVLRSLINKNTFRSKTLANAIGKSLTAVVVHTFDDTDLDMNSSKGSTAAAIENYYDEDRQVFNKTNADEIYIYTATKVVSSGNNKAWAIADWTNVDGGSVELAISRNSGVSYSILNADVVTDISTQGTGVAMDLRIKLTGKLILKNVAWGCKA